MRKGGNKKKRREIKKGKRGGNTSYTTSYQEG